MTRAAASPATKLDGSLGQTTFDAKGQTRIPIEIGIKEVKSGRWITR